MKEPVFYYYKNTDALIFEKATFNSYSDAYVCITENVEYMMFNNISWREECERTGWPKPEKFFFTHMSSVIDYKKAVETFQRTHHGYKAISAEEFWKKYEIVPARLRVFDKF